MTRFRLPKLPAPGQFSDLEHSVHFRVAVLVNTLFAFWAYATIDEDLQLLVPIAGILVGSAYSYWRRGKSNFWVKWLLAAGMLYALWQALDNLVRATIDPRLSLAQLLLWLQVLNSFDLPRRKNLRVGLLVTAILMVVTGTMSRTMAYGAMLAGYALTTLWAFHEAYLSEAGLKRPSWRQTAGTAVAALTGVALLALPLFLLAPRQERHVSANTLPMSVRLPLPPQLDTRVRSAALFATQGGKPIANRGYNGFSDELDLNIRSAPSESVVMRVKSDRPQYWRAMAFDRYDGRKWRMSEPAAVDTHDVPPFRIDRPKGQAAGIALLQTFYIEEDQANLIFAAWNARQLYFPTALVWSDRYDGLRSPVQLQKAMYYTVLSETPIFDGASLMHQAAEPVPTERRKYLQLPPAITDRTRAEVKRLTAGATTPYAVMRRLREHLQSTYRYRLDVPEAPEGREWVDHFLFDQREGFCEQFATSLAVMGRLEGIPTRLVTGFVPGDYNPFSGFYEVKGKHAHAWVEAWIPRQGWVPFDPTPASNELEGITPETPPVQNPTSALLAYLFPWLASRPWLAMAMGVAAIGLGGMLWKLRWLPGLPERVGVPTALYRRLRRRASKLGVAGRPSDTPGAWLEAASRVPETAQALPELEAFVTRYEAARFGGGDEAALVAAAKDAENALQRRPSKP